MRPSFPCLLAVGLLGLFALAPQAARAGDLPFPKSAPVLTFTLPDGWKIAEVPGQGHLIVCTTPHDTNFVISLMALPPTATLSDRDAILAKSARTAAAGANLTDITVSSVTEEKIGAGARTFAMVRANGKLKGSSATVVYAAFTLADDGPFYMLGEAGPDASLLSHKDEFQKVANSIQPLAAPTPTPAIRLAPPPAAN